MDFWNNPILVSTVRNKFRGGYLLHVLAVYPVVLLLLGSAVPVFYPQILPDLPHHGFIALVVLQFSGSGLVATASASQSLKSEVVNQTLDFLRLAPLTPWQILTGKMMGEASLPFFAAVASFPVAVVCWALEGVDIVTMVLLYINLLLYVLLCGAAGLTMRLEMRDDKRVESVSMLSLTGWMSALPILGTLSLSLPYRVAALAALPLVMIGLGFAVLHVMARAMESPFKPPMSKPVAYALLVAVDLVAGVAVATLLSPLTTGGKVVAFWAIHLGATAYVISGVTPWRESLRTWCWRFRGRVPAWRDAWFGDRFENGPAVLLDITVGLVIYALVFVPVLYFVDGEKEFRGNLDALWGAPLLSVVLIFTYGAIFQWNSLIFGRSGNGLIVLFIAALVAPYYLGLLEDIGWVSQLSPFAHYAQWFVEKPEQLPHLAHGQLARARGSLEMLGILTAFLAGLGLLARSSFRARMRYMGRIVDRKLEKMGVSRSVSTV